MNGEHFLDVIDHSSTQDDAFFEYDENPFKKDIEGKDIDFGPDITFPESLFLKPDLTTLRDAIWLDNEAFVLADVYDHDK
jgi:hypothetical protein